MKLLKEYGDIENYESIQVLKNMYKDKAFKLMRENNINQIEIDVSKNIKTTLKIDKNIQNL